MYHYCTDWSHKCSSSPGSICQSRTEDKCICTLSWLSHRWLHSGMGYKRNRHRTASRRELHCTPMDRCTWTCCSRLWSRCHCSCMDSTDMGPVRSDSVSQWNRTSMCKRCRYRRHCKYHRSDRDWLHTPLAWFHSLVRWSCLDRYICIGWERAQRMCRCFDTVWRSTRWYWCHSFYQVYQAD